jgi:hypothetical protein
VSSAAMFARGSLIVAREQVQIVALQIQNNFHKMHKCPGTGKQWLCY